MYENVQYGLLWIIGLKGCISEWPARAIGSVNGASLAQAICVERRLAFARDSKVSAAKLAEK